MTTSAPITPLTPALHRVAKHLVDGLTLREIAARTELSVETVRQYVRNIRESLHCPPRCKPPVIVHSLLAGHHVAVPRADRPTPELSPEQHMLLQALAEHSGLRDIAAAAHIAPADVRSAQDELLDTARAANATQLVVLAHGWGLLHGGAADQIEGGASQ
ncbi:DNA-binding protein [Streptomyces chartreusis]|uniref:DNA-binding protein n=1 Tax=Streptomyces chartreusis TaxID=1969 RepID=UPI00382C2CC0